MSPLYELYFLQGLAARIGHLSPMRRMTLRHGLGRYLLGRTRGPGTCGSAGGRIRSPSAPDLADQRFEVGPRHMPRVRQVMEVCGSGQPGYPQQMVEPVSLPCEQSDDGAFLASRDLFARRARSFSRYATFALR